MSTTQTQTELMARTAARFDAVGDALDGMLKRLMAELDQLKSQWQGAGGRTFDETRRAWADDQERLRRALAETAGAIRTAGRDYAVADASAAERVRHVRGHLPLPL